MSADLIANEAVGSNLLTNQALSNVPLLANEAVGSNLLTNQALTKAYLLANEAVEVVGEGGVATRHVEPPVAHEQLLVEQRAVGAQERAHQRAAVADVEHWGAESLHWLEVSNDCN